jgi:hypothetical protein
MDKIYVLLGSDWEDMEIILNELEAINLSIKYKNSRIEIFQKNIYGNYTPTYNYYKNGIIIYNS